MTKHPSARDVADANGHKPRLSGLPSQSRSAHGYADAMAGHGDRGSHRKVFGVGWAKTGTTTLGKCLRSLGYRHMSQRLDLVDAYAEGNRDAIISVAREADSFEDWPWILLYQELDQAFPGSLFILTTRDHQRWIKSYLNMLRMAGEPTARLNEIRSVLYGLPFPDVTPAALVERYLRHNRHVIDYFATRPEALLVVDWERGHGWEELCTFLGMSVPAASFPHENRGDYTSLPPSVAESKEKQDTA